VVCPCRNRKRSSDRRAVAVAFADALLSDAQYEDDGVVRGDDVVLG
jgi:hypothetical protein